jgi:hypothetical protein
MPCGGDAGSALTVRFATCGDGGDDAIVPIPPPAGDDVDTLKCGIVALLQIRT